MKKMLKTILLLLVSQIIIINESISSNSTTTVDYDGGTDGSILVSLVKMKFHISYK